MASYDSSTHNAGATDEAFTPNRGDWAELRHYSPQLNAERLSQVEHFNQQLRRNLAAKVLKRSENWKTTKQHYGSK